MTNLVSNFEYLLLLCFLTVAEFWNLGHLYPLLNCTWFLKNQFRKIKFDQLDFLPILKLIFTACVACKNQFQNWFLQAKNPVHRNWFFQLDFSKFKHRSTGGLTISYYELISWWYLVSLYIVTFWISHMISLSPRPHKKRTARKKSPPTPR